MKNYKQILFFLSFLVILFNFTGVFLHVSDIFKGYLYILLWVVVFSFIYPRRLSNIKYLLLGMFFLMAFTYGRSGGKWVNINSPSQVILVILYFTIPVLMYDFFLHQVQRRGVKSFVIFTFVVIGVLAARTISVAVDNPDIVRLAVEDEDLTDYLQRFGCGTYSLCHAVAFIFPAIIYGLRYKYTKNWQRILGGLMMTFLFYYIIMCGATTPFLLGIILTLSSLLIKKHFSIKRNAIRISIGLAAVLVVFFVFNGLAYINMFGDWLTPDNSIYGKIFELNEFMAYGSSEGDASERSGMLSNSLHAFFESPLIGSPTAKIAGHNFFIDCLGAIGLMGTIPLFLFLWYSIKEIKKSLNHDCRPFFMMGILSFVFLGFVKNYFGIEMFIIPLTIFPLMLQLFAENSAVNKGNKKVQL